MVFEAILGLIGLVCAIWVIVDVWTKNPTTTGRKILWTILALLFSIITAIVYYLTQKR